MRRVPAIVACLLAALVLASPAPAETRPGDLRVATTTKIDTLNPLIGTHASEYRVWALNYDLLIAFDQKSMEPDRGHSLASSWGASKDQRTWTYHLKPNLQVVRRRAADGERRRLDDELHAAPREVERRRGRHEVGGDESHDGRRAPPAPLRRDGVALDLRPSRARLEEGRLQEVGHIRPEAAARRLGPVHGRDVEPERHHRDEAQPVLPGSKHGPRAGADDVLRRREPGGQGPRAEPAGRDAQRHAQRAGREAIGANERRARLSLARDGPRVLGLRPRSARGPTSAQGGRPRPRDPHGAGLGDRPLQARAGLAPGIRRTWQHAALAHLRRLHARPLEGPDAGLPLRPGPGEAHPRHRRMEGRPRRRAPQERRARGLRARLLGPSGRAARRQADPSVGARRRHRDRRQGGGCRQAAQPRVRHGRQEAHTRLRHPGLVDQRRAVARVPALALHEGPAWRLERLGVRRHALRAALRAREDRAGPRGAHRGHPHAAADRQRETAVHRAVRAGRPRSRQHAHVAALDDAAFAGRTADHALRLRHGRRPEAAGPRELELPGRPLGAGCAGRARPAGPDLDAARAPARPTRADRDRGRPA